MPDQLAIDAIKTKENQLLSSPKPSSSNNHEIITPLQQMISSCTGSILTSILVTPLDVVKIRLQAQQKEFMKNKCFLYCNGLMDHVCYCLNGNGNGNNTASTNGVNNKSMKNMSTTNIIINKNNQNNDPPNNNSNKKNPQLNLNGNNKLYSTVFNNNKNNNIFKNIISNNIISNNNISNNSFSSSNKTINKIQSSTSHHHQSHNKSHCHCSYYHSISCKNLTDKQIKDLWYRRPNYFNGTLDGLIKIARHEGITSLWSGLPPTLVMAIPATVMYFTIYDQICTRMRRIFQIDRDHVTSILIPALAGGSARFVAATIISPLEMIRTKMQSQKLSYREIHLAVMNLIQTKGKLSLWTGLNATLLRDIPFSMLYWLNYENFKRIFHQYDYNFGFSFCFGAASGAIAATITLPFDVVKTYRQIELGQQLFNNPKNIDSVKTMDILKKIYQERGYRGLFAGISPRLIKVAPACAIMISTYEAGKSFFHKYNQSKLIQQQLKQQQQQQQ